VFQSSVVKINKQANERSTQEDLFIPLISYLVRFFIY